MSHVLGTIKESFYTRENIAFDWFVCHQNLDFCPTERNCHIDILVLYYSISQRKLS